MRPEDRAVGGGHAGDPSSTHQQDLRQAADRHQMRRAIASARRFHEPALGAGRAVVGDECARGGDNDEVVDDQWGARDAPARNRHAGIGHRVARPHGSAVAGVEGIQDSGRAECVDATVAEGGCRTRTSAAVRLIEPDRITVCPDRLTGAPLCNRRRPRVRPAAPVCRSDPRRLRTMTSPVRWPGATTGRGAMQTSSFPDARRGCCCRGQVRESQATRLA